MKVELRDLAPDERKIVQQRFDELAARRFAPSPKKPRQEVWWPRAPLDGRAFPEGIHPPEADASFNEAVRLMLVFLRRRRPLIAHAAFSLHFYSFLLLLLCVAAVVQAMDGWVGGFGLTHDRLDHLLSISLLMASAVYLYLSIAPVYGTRGVARVAATLVLMVFVGVIALGYRFALLLVTLYSTS